MCQLQQQLPQSCCIAKHMTACSYVHGARISLISANMQQLALRPYQLDVCQSATACLVLDVRLLLSRTSLQCAESATAAKTCLTVFSHLMVFSHLSDSLFTSDGLFTGRVCKA